MEKIFPPGHHYHLKKGDVDPELNKTVEEVVLNTDDFVVYVDSDCAIQWRTTDDHVATAHCGEILNLVAAMEAQSQFITDRNALCLVRRQIEVAPFV